jgi:hypothetical protein
VVAGLEAANMSSVKPMPEEAAISVSRTQRDAGMPAVRHIETAGGVTPRPTATFEVPPRRSMSVDASMTTIIQIF